MNFLRGEGTAMTVEGLAPKDTGRVQDDPKHATRTVHLRAFFMLGVFENCKICMYESTGNTVKKFLCHAKLTF